MYLVITDYWDDGIRTQYKVCDSPEEMERAVYNYWVHGRDRLRDNEATCVVHEIVDEPLDTNSIRVRAMATIQLIKASEQREKEFQEHQERAELARLKEKYES